MAELVTSRQFEVEASAARQQPARIYGCGLSPASRWCQCVLALAVLIAVATVLIAPSIDMPDGMLRDHNVVTHSAGHVLGSLTVSTRVDPTQTHHLRSAVRFSENRQGSSRGHDQRTLVLRC